jgi:hypothetical protein
VTQIFYKSGGMTHPSGWHGVVISCSLRISVFLHDPQFKQEDVSS